MSTPQIARRQGYTLLAWAKAAVLEEAFRAYKKGGVVWPVCYSCAETIDLCMEASYTFYPATRLVADGVMITPEKEVYCSACWHRVDLGLVDSLVYIDCR